MGAKNKQQEQHDNWNEVSTFLPFKTDIGGTIIDPHNDLVGKLHH